MQQIHRKKSAKSVYFRISIQPHLQILISGVMALRHKIEWDPEEVAEGYDFSSIYEGVDENTTVPVISSVVNTTDQAGPATNITAGLSNLLMEVVEQVVEMVSNTTINPTTITPTTVAPFSGSSPSTVSTIVKRVVEHLGKKPSSPVATVCISYFCETINRVHHGTVQYNLYSILQNRINILRCAVYNNVQIVS